MDFDPYLALEISKTVTQDEIRASYRKLAKKYHPDLKPGNFAAEKKFIEITKAKELLETPEEREKFDKREFEQPEGFPFGNQSQGPFYYHTQNGGGGYTYSFAAAEPDLFASLFKNFNNRGKDQFFNLEVDFKEAVLGAEREVVFGQDNSKRFKLKIPAGIVSGKKLRSAGKGFPGSGKGSAGDLYINIQVKPSPIFKRVGNNLEMELPISLNEAILGGTVEVPTVENSIKLNIPPGSNTGLRLRVKDKGVKNEALKNRGDLFVMLKIVLPQIIDTELKDVIQKWSVNHSYNPRSDAPGFTANILASNRAMMKVFEKEGNLKATLDGSEYELFITF